MLEDVIHCTSVFVLSCAKIILPADDADNRLSNPYIHIHY